MKDERLVQSHEEMQELDKQKLKMLITILKQMLNPNTNSKPELLEYDCVNQLKNLVKKFYIRKGQIAESLHKKLDTIIVERPSNLERKKEYFFKDAIASENARLRNRSVLASPSVKKGDKYDVDFGEEHLAITDDGGSSFHETTTHLSPRSQTQMAQTYQTQGMKGKVKHQRVEMERVRLRAEIDRVNRYRYITEKYAAPYYDICQKLVENKCDQKPVAQYIMDYFKVLLECGQEFTHVEYTAIYKHMKDNNMLNDDALK